MNNINIIAAIFVVMVFFRYLLKRSETVFLIRIKNRNARLVKGLAPGRFISECCEIAGIRKTIRGSITGIREKGGIRLGFSRSISEPERQIFRNVWSITCTGGNLPSLPRAGKRAKIF